MRKLWTMLKLDATLITRDKVVLYMAVAPVLLALVFMAVVGQAGAGTLTFVAAAGVPPEVVQNLERLARVERVSDDDALVARVERMDSVAGVYMQGGRTALLLEGNEAESFGAQAGLLLARAAAGDIQAFSSREVESAGSLILTITAISILLMAMLLAGSVLGMIIVGERESKALHALAVSPLNLAGYVSTRTAMALLLALVNVALCAAVLGVGENLPSLLLATLASVPLLGLYALVLGITAGNQITAFATLKLLMPAALLVPISSLFVPDGFKLLYWWAPMYWQFEAVAAGYSGRFEPAYLALTLATGAVWLVVLTKLARRPLGLR